MFFSIAWRVILQFREDNVGPSFSSLTFSSYTERTPRPTNPILRPAYQGSNPVADIFSMWALRTTVKYLPRIAKDSTDHEARSQMLCVLTLLLNTISANNLHGYCSLAASFAGIGFGNAGVHLCHGMSYPVSSSG